MTYLDLLRKNLVTLRDTFGRATNISATVISIIVANDRSFYHRVAQKDFMVGTYDKIAARYAALWPRDVPWPIDVPRPEPAEIEQETIDFIKSTISVHPDWKAGDEWPSDIPPPAAHPIIPAIAETEKA
jgi:hypothetical protein